MPNSFAAQLKVLQSLSSLGLTAGQTSAGIRAYEDRAAYDEETRRLEEEYAKKAKRAKRREKRRGRGRLFGSALGAIIGSLIAPGVGTAIGAGLGSYGGQRAGAERAFTLGKPLGAKRAKTLGKVKYQKPDTLFGKSRSEELAGEARDINRELRARDEEFFQSMFGQAGTDALTAYMGAPYLQRGMDVAAHLPGLLKEHGAESLLKYVGGTSAAKTSTPKITQLLGANPFKEQFPGQPSKRFGLPGLDDKITSRVIAQILEELEKEPEDEEEFTWEDIPGLLGGRE